MYASYQFPWFEWLGQIIVCTKFKTHNTIGDLSVGGQHEDRKLPEN